MSLGSNPARVIRRIEKELQNLRRDPIDGCSAQPKDARNLFEWIASIQGPPYSPYAGGIFHMDIRFPNDYPLKPPTVTFVTKIYHPNIESQNGYIGLNILHKEWSPVLTISLILLSLRAFLGSPDLESALVPEVAEEYERDTEAFERTAVEWTEKYAK